MAPTVADAERLFPSCLLTLRVILLLCFSLAAGEVDTLLMLCFFVVLLYNGLMRSKNLFEEEGTEEAESSHLVVSSSNLNLTLRLLLLGSFFSVVVDFLKEKARSFSLGCRRVIGD